VANYQIDLDNDIDEDSDKTSVELFKKKNYRAHSVVKQTIRDSKTPSKPSLIEDSASLIPLLKTKSKKFLELNKTLTFRNNSCRMQPYSNVPSPNHQIIGTSKSSLHDLDPFEVVHEVQDSNIKVELPEERLSTDYMFIKKMTQDDSKPTIPIILSSPERSLSKMQMPAWK